MKIFLALLLNSSLILSMQMQVFNQKNFYADLINAITTNNLDKIKDFLSNKDFKDKINYENHAGMTPLIVAVYIGNKDIVEFLIDSGADINYKTNHYQWSALMEALFEGNKDLVDLLIKKGATTLGCDISGIDYLFDLRSFKNFDQQNEDRFKRLLKYVGNPNIVKNGRSILMESFGFGIDNILITLLKSPANNYIKEKFDKKFGYYSNKIINILLVAGADINYKNNKGQSVYSCANQHNKKQIVFDYIDSLIDQIKIVFENKENLEFNICYKNFKDIILKIGSIKIRDKNKNNLLHLAFASGNLFFVQIICRLSPDLISQENNLGQTPISLIFNNSSSFKDLLGFIKLEYSKIDKTQ